MTKTEIQRIEKDITTIKTRLTGLETNLKKLKIKLNEEDKK